MEAGSIILRAHDWVVELDPDHGGQIVRADWQGLPVLLPGQAGRATAAQHAGCFPLVPFSNRIREAAFRFLGREIHLPPPEYMQPHALHGTGWRTSWSAETSGPGNARMWFEHPRGPWPWRYRAEQTVSLESGQLHISLSILNLDSEPMPAGIGFHPYFIRPQGLWLNAHTGGRWATLRGETGLPHAREAAPENLGAPGHDHCFYGWNRQAEFGGASGLTVSITASASLGNLVIYTPPGKPYFCAEPVSHVNNAINLDGLPEAERMTILQPGELLSGTMTLSGRLA